MTLDWKRSLQNFLYGSAAYPALNLADAAVVETQRRNIAVFKARWRRLILGFMLAVFCMPGIPLLMDYFVDPNWDKTHGAWFIFPFFIAGIATMIFMFQYKCPHCRAVPSGVNWGVGADGVASYSKGIHLFPVRCAKCGYYLATRALRKDLQAANEHK